jgi:hypothetical protein
MDAIENMATLDIEIVEDNVNNSFMWIVFNPKVLAIVNLNTGASNAYALNWGTATNTRTLHPRIVSDNAAYPDIPYIYIIAQQWTLLGSDPNIYSVLEMTAKCVSPFSVTPIVSFGSHVDYPENAVNTIPDYTTDIAYFRNGSNDSLVILINNAGSEMKILTHSIFSFGNGLGRYIGNLNPQSNTIPEQRAYMATNGAFNKIMVVFKRRYSINDWDIAYYKSTLGTGGWVNGYIDFSGYDAYGDARIIGERNNPGKFHVAYQRQIFSQISYCSSINYTWNSPIFPFSDTRSYAYTGPDLGNPAPGYTTLINEPCFAVWIDSTGKNLKSSAGCSGSFLQPTKKLLMFGAIQGLYNNMTDLMIHDTVTVYLRNAVSPFAKIDSSKKKLYGPATGQYFSFNNAQNGTPYYVEVKHRNALETWSAEPVSFVSDATSLAFSVDDFYAYGNNQIQVDNTPYNVFAFYSGDVNQDGAIDLTDVLLIYNSANSFVTGYVATDLTGENIVDLTDLLMAYNNAAAFVSVLKPLL